MTQTKADWLRSEIEKIEKMMVRNGSIQNWYGMEEPITEDEADGFNIALTTIITRYKEELLELENVK